MTLDDLRRLNIREAGNWPLLPKAAFLLTILVAIVAAGAVLDWKDQYEALDRAQQEESKRKEEYATKKAKAINYDIYVQQLKEIEQSFGALLKEYATKKAKAINYDIYVQQLKEIEQSFGALLKQLPNKAEMDALLTDINQAGLGRGLEFELFKPAAQERLADFYAELPITVKITGNYHDMGAFASDVAQLPRIVTLNDLVIANDKGVLTMDAVAKTFRYLDEEELAKQRKAAKDAKDKAKK
jgi:type IV pilus assembly protein PilO